jgi:predicted nicotinamide N-methyase
MVGIVLFFVATACLSLTKAFLTTQPFKALSFHLPRSTVNLYESSTDCHIVEGVVCRKINIDVPTIGRVKVLEATAESQEDLVDMALALEEEAAENQVLSAGDPYGAVLWPAAWAVSNYILSNSTMKAKLPETTILELGTGTGLVSIATAIGGAKRVIATDYEPLTLKLVSYAGATFHSLSETTLHTQLLDMRDYYQPLPHADLVVAADIMYEPKTGEAMAHRAVEALKNNCRVIVGDSPGRPGRPAFLKTLQELGVKGAYFFDTIGKTCTGPRHDLICGSASTSVSETTKELTVAILDLHPSMLEER